MQKKIFLLEDDPLDLDLIKQQLVGAHVAHTPSLKESIEFLKNNPIDIILTDLNVQDSRGIDTYLQLSKHYPDLPILVLSNITDKKTAIFAVQKGAQDFFFKEDLHNKKQLNMAIDFAIERAKNNFLLKKAEFLARQQSEFKSNFIAQFSHEIRTPLNAVIGMASILDTCIENEDGQSILESLKIGADRLLAIVNEILDISKIESGKMEIFEEVVNVRDAVESIVLLFSKTADNLNIYLTSIVEKDVPFHIVTDSKRLKQILSNLIGNALKFTKDGKVVVRVSKEVAGFINFEIKDSGSGISPDDLNKLFEPFVQVGDKEARKKGSGLGLAICKKLVECLGGKITAESKLGQGSIFKFTIRATQEHVQISERFDFKNKKIALIGISNLYLANIANQLDIRQIPFETFHDVDTFLQANYNKFKATLFDHFIICEYFKKIQLKIPTILLSKERLGSDLYIKTPVIQSQLYKILARSMGEVSTQVVTKETFCNFSHLQVLIVDDDPINIRVLLKMLARLSIAAQTVSNGEEAISFFRKGDRIDFIFMDCSMPVMNGFEAAKILREEGCLAKIIALTGFAFEEDRKKCIASGMDEFLTKPIRIKDLEDVFKKLS